MTPLGTIIAAARRRAGLTQRQLAYILGITEHHMGHIEQGYRGFPYGRLDRLPWSIREPVIEALIVSHQEAIKHLREQLAATGEHSASEAA